MSRQLHFNLFILACGHHQAAWRVPDSQVERLGQIDYYIELARAAEAAKLDAVFFADGQFNFNVEQGPRWFIEPLSSLSALAAATESIGLITTVSSTFYTPFLAARMLASIDHISRGRVGANIVTSMYDAEARNYDYERMPTHEQRYERAQEFIEVMRDLWDSWSDEALVIDRQGQYANPQEIQPINHAGKHFLVDGPLTVPRPPQGHAVLFQAGSSEPGRDLAARRAEAIYAVAYDLTAAQAYYRDIKRRVKAAGRQDAVPIMPGLVTYVASTQAEALAKQRELDELLPAKASLRQLESFIFQDCLSWDLDGPVPPLPPLEEFKGPKGRYAT